MRFLRHRDLVLESVDSLLSIIGQVILRIRKNPSSPSSKDKVYWPASAPMKFTVQSAMSELRTAGSTVPGFKLVRG